MLQIEIALLIIVLVVLLAFGLGVSLANVGKARLRKALDDEKLLHKKVVKARDVVVSECDKKDRTLETVRVNLKNSQDFITKLTQKIDQQKPLVEAGQRYRSTQDAYNAKKKAERAMAKAKRGSSTVSKPSRRKKAV